jgi:uncharacterized RDD family membrane protein YckC
MLRRLSFVFVLLCATSVMGHAETAAPAAAGSAATAAPSDTPASPAAAGAENDFNDLPGSDWQGHRDWHKRNRRERHDRGSSLVSIGHDSYLSSGRQADSVVSVLGSSTSDGEADDVVSVFGNTRVTGQVSDSAVAVMGSTYIDSKVDGDVVAVLGDVDLGPHAEVGGDVVSVLGVVHRDPAAIVHGGVQSVAIGSGFGAFEWLHTWIRHCLLYGRPLAFAPGLGWAWTLALGFLAFYALLALCFRPALVRCVQTLETQPGSTALAALLTMLLTPVLLVLLCITVIGIAAVPFVVMSLFCASLFGKAVMLAWIGGRITNQRPGSAVHPALAVLIGGAIVLVLYVVPVLGFLVYKLLGFFGFGAVVYTLVLAARARRAANGEHPGTRPPAGADGPAAETSMADAAAAGGSEAAAAGAAGAAGAAPAAGAASGPTAASAPYPPAPPLSHVTAAMPRAGFWIRMAALLLDVVLVGVLMSFLHPFRDVHIVILAVYGAVMWKLRGTTVGGIVFDLHVVRLDGRPVDWETAIVRALGCFLSLFVVFLGFIWIAFDANHQAWHDKIAGTVVVQAKKSAPLV